MTSTTSSAPGFKAGLFNAASTLWAAETTVLVTYGMPAFDPFDDVVSFASTTSSSEFGPAGPNHSRREDLTQEVIIYSFRAGGQEQEVVVMQRAYELLADLEEYVRATDTTLGGAMQHCFLVEHASDAATDQDVLSKGRLHVLTATFAGRGKPITSNP